MISASTKWLRCAQPNPKATLKLICFPHAGGNASSYANWHRSLSTDVEILAVQLPGRENRLNETPSLNWHDLIQALADVIAPITTQADFIFFGHSLGALMAFELARQLRREGLAQPQRLLLSGHSAPHLPITRSPIHHLPDDEFVRKIVAMDGTPKSLATNPEWREMWLPAARADFALSENYIYTDAAPLGCPILALGGVQDSGVPLPGLQAWREQTSGEFKAIRLPGGHFYLTEQREWMMQLLQHEMHAAKTKRVQTQQA